MAIKIYVTTDDYLKSAIKTDIRIYGTFVDF